MFDDCISLLFVAIHTLLVIIFLDAIPNHSTCD